MAVGRFVHDAHRITDSVTMISSCSSSPRLIVLFLLLWMPGLLDPLVPALLISAAFWPISDATCPKPIEESGNTSNVPKLVSVERNHNLNSRVTKYAEEVEQITSIKLP